MQHATIISRLSASKAFITGWLCFLFLISGCAYIGQSTADSLAQEKLASEQAERIAIWIPLREGFALPALPQTLVARQLTQYTRSSAHLRDSLLLATPYLYFILDELKKRNMPTELAMLPFLESGFNVRRGNSLNHAGLWGLMPIAAKHLNLVQTPFVDQRRDIVASTRAALDLMQELHTKFGDWNLALAAYNWGPGNVTRALENNKRRQLPQDYLNLKMPVETAVFIPKLHALRQIIENPAAYNIVLPDIPNRPYFAQVAVKQAIDISLVLQFSGLSRNEFIDLNPSFNRTVIPGGSEQKILLPVASVTQYLQNYQGNEKTLSPLSSVVIETPQTIDALAKIWQVDANRIRQLNGLPWGITLKVGAVIMIPKPSLKIE